ncbi:MAG TPA: tetratricopeptide repeat protein [Polyangiaceae bacterium]|nr:tetratricopeptide repeat protein [Polyangiaceae bacterium]
MAFGLTARPGFAADPGAPPPDDAVLPGDERVVELNEQGSALYAAGDYRRAAERFLQAYAVDEDPNLLFNIGSCYEALGDIDAALEKYRAFLAAPLSDPEGRPRAERAIARLAALDDAPPAAEPSPPPPPATPTAPAVAPADTGTTSARWVPWAGLAGGVALGAIGTTFYLVGAADHSQVTDTAGFDDPDAVAGITRRRADDLVAAGDTKKAIGLASASVGAALIAGSIVWWLVDPLEPPNQHSGLEVTWTEAQRGLRYSGVF